MSLQMIHDSALHDSCAAKIPLYSLSMDNTRTMYRGETCKKTCAKSIIAHLGRRARHSGPCCLCNQRYRESSTLTKAQTEKGEYSIATNEANECSPELQ